MVLVIVIQRVADYAGGVPTIVLTLIGTRRFVVESGQLLTKRDQSSIKLG